MRLAIILTNLAVAALFNPLRRRLQSLIDRQFYHRKYNAQKILDNFSTIARDEVDLVKLTNHLVAATEDTLLPSKISLWLRR